MFERAVRFVEASRPLRHLINGFVASGVHYACLTFFLCGLNMPSAGVANFLAALFGIGTSFLGSRYFVFRELSETILHQLAPFVLFYGVVAVSQAFLLFSWTDVMGLNPSSGFLVGVVMQAVISYFGNKHLVFRKSGVSHAD